MRLPRRTGVPPVSLRRFAAPRLKEIWNRNPTKWYTLPIPNPTGGKHRKPAKKRSAISSYPNLVKCAAQFLGLFLIIVEAGCGTSGVPHGETSVTGRDLVTLQEKLLTRQNPTAYEFGATIEDVKPAIQRAFADHYWKDAGPVNQAGEDQDPPFGADLFWKESDADPLCQGVFAKPENENDAFLYGGDFAFGKSQVYFKNSVPLTYFADFHIHLVPIGALKTRVEIFTYNRWVSAGLDKSSLLGPAYIGVDVGPTTIEESRFYLKLVTNLASRICQNSLCRDKMQQFDRW